MGGEEGEGGCVCVGVGGWGGRSCHGDVFEYSCVDFSVRGAKMAIKQGDLMLQLRCTVHAAQPERFVHSARAKPDCTTRHRRCTKIDFHRHFLVAHPAPVLMHRHTGHWAMP